MLTGFLDSLIQRLRKWKKTQLLTLYDDMVEQFIDKSYDRCVFKSPDRMKDISIALSPRLRIKKSRIMSPTIANNDCLDQILNTEQTWTGISRILKPTAFVFQLLYM